jgi:MoaA/NifB/PqqE/SkfB family radical SAM enzyme
MKIEIVDKSLMMIILLEKCNFNCVHCLREYEPMEVGYQLSYKQFQLCLSDCRELKGISWVHFTGGEPTLWKEKDRNLVDLLLEISKAGFTPGLTSNGSFFVNYGRTRDFFARYFDGSSMPLRIYLSIDTFHKNFDPIKEKAKSLDNILRLKKRLPRAQADRLGINVMAVISKDSNSLLPEKMIRDYESRGVSFGFLPLLSLGRADSFKHLCPDLNSDNPEDLGAYRHFFREKDRMRTEESGDRNRADFINLIGSDYYFTNPWRKVGRLGNLPDSIINAYSNPNDCI